MLQREVHVAFDTDAALLQMNSRQHRLGGEHVFEGSEYDEGLINSVTRAQQLDERDGGVNVRCIELQRIAQRGFIAFT